MIKGRITGNDRSQAEALSHFQQMLSLDRIYLKNNSSTLKHIEEYDTVKVLTWNIARGVNPDVLAEYINGVGPDVVCLQEVDWANRRTKEVDVLSQIAHATGMLGLFGVEFLEIQTRDRPKELAGGGAQGNAILTRVRPSKYFRIKLPPAFDWVNVSGVKNRIAQREKRLGGRFALCVEFDYFGRSIVVCSTHFEDKDGGVEGRFAQFKCVANTIGAMTPEDATVIIAGDFNSLENWITSIIRTDQQPKSLGKPSYISECRWWKEHLLPKSGYSDSFTCNDWTYKTSIIYKEKLDWIAVRNCHVVRQGLGDFNSSDHRPIWSEIRL